MFKRSAQDKLNRILLDAARDGDTAKVQALIVDGANVNVVNYGGGTPLHVAVLMGHAAIVQALIDAHANVNVVDKVGDTPLHVVAGMESRTEIVQALIAGRANVNAVNNEGRTPLYWAVRRGHTATVQALIVAGADLNVVDRFGDTPLHGAARGGHTATVQTLIDAGANLKNLELPSGLKAAVADILLPAAAAAGNLALVNKLLEIPEFLANMDNGQRPYTSAVHSAICAFQRAAANQHALNKKALPVDAILSRLLEIKSVRVAILEETDHISEVPPAVTLIEVEQEVRASSCILPLMQRRLAQQYTVGQIRSRDTTDEINERIKKLSINN